MSAFRGSDSMLGEKEHDGKTRTVTRERKRYVERQKISQRCCGSSACAVSVQGLIDCTVCVCVPAEGPVAL